MALSSGLPRAQTLVILDEKFWSDFWKELTRSSTPGVSLPQVDFVREQVFVAALGPQNAGHDIQITAVQEIGDTNYVNVLAREGVAPACRTDEGNSPLAIVIVARTDSPVKFVQNQVTLDCAS